jgi:hypothetical protein
LNAHGAIPPFQLTPGAVAQPATPYTPW